MVANPDLMLQAAQSQTVAAWVQAFGSIGAILAAGFIAGWQSRSETRLRKATEQIVARDFAMLIERPMRAWTAKAKEWLRVLNLMDGMGEWAMISQLAESPDLMEPPTEVWRFVGRFRDFGPAANRLQEAAVAWNAISDGAAKIRATWSQGDAVEESDTSGREWIVGMIRRYANAVIEANEAVESLKKS